MMEHDSTWAPGKSRGPLVGRVLIVAVAKTLFPLCHTESHSSTWIDYKNYQSPTGILPYNIRI